MSGRLWPTVCAVPIVQIIKFNGGVIQGTHRGRRCGELSDEPKQKGAKPTFMRKFLHMAATLSGYSTGAVIAAHQLFQNLIAFMPRSKPRQTVSR